MIATMNQAAILMPSGPLDDVGDGRVDEHDDTIAKQELAAPLARLRQRDRDRRRCHEHQHAGRVRAALRFDVGLEDDRDQESDGR